MNGLHTADIICLCLMIGASTVSLSWSAHHDAIVMHKYLDGIERRLILMEVNHGR